MDGAQSRTPQVALVVTTYELREDNVFAATVTHTFFGDTGDEARRVLEAHKKTDSFFNASFTGKFDGIILRDSEPQIFTTKA